MANQKIEPFVHAQGTKPNEVSIAGADLVFRSVVFSDPVPTGRQVIQAFVGDDPAKFIALQWLANGVLEELRLDEKVDLRARGLSASLSSAVTAFSSSRSMASGGNGRAVWSRAQP